MAAAYPTTYLVDNLVLEDKDKTPLGNRLCWVNAIKDGYIERC